MGTLTVKQEKFCLSIIKHGNDRQAAREAGYKGNDNVLSSIARQNKQLPKIMHRINELKEQMQTPLIASAEERRDFLTKIIRGELLETIYTSDGIITIPPKIVDRIKASDQLNKMDCLYTQKVDVTGVLPVIIHDDIDEAEEAEEVEKQDDG